MSLTWSLQALLIRHEAYVADAEQDRRRMAEEIEQLKDDKLDLQTKNTAIIDENRALLEQIESVNGAATDSDHHIRSLNATLLTTQQELQKLSALARRTETLERELEQFEREQARLQTSLTSKTEDERAATQRWQSAERMLASLEDKIDHIDREAREEKERHADTLDRLERKRAVEKELDSVAGRLRGPAAAVASRRTSLDKNGSGVVTHFVKDILQDNANLQLSIVELRESLANSNDEVERLREQLEQYEIQNIDADTRSNHMSRPSLSEELGRRSAQEVHVHHHYHAPSPSIDNHRKSSATLRRPKKKRYGLSSGQLTPSSGYRTPNGSTSTFGHSVSSPIVPQLDTTRPPPRQRWSMQSSQTPSSLPSSPRSAYQAPSLFDRSFSDVGMESSRPTTPDSDALESPSYASSSKRFSASSYKFPSGPFRSGSAPDSIGDHMPEAEKTRIPDANPAPIPEEVEEPEPQVTAFTRTPVVPNGVRHSRIVSATDDDFVQPRDTGFAMRPLRRAASHESLLSVSGMDIHTLRDRPSQMLTGQSTRATSSQPVVSATTAHAAARPMLTHRSSADRSRSLLSGMANEQRQVSAPSVNTNATFGSKLGGWFGRWGGTAAMTSAAAPSLTTAGHNLNVVKTRSGTATAAAGTHRNVSPAVLAAAAAANGAATIKKSDTRYRPRPPGINQPGSIFAIAAAAAAAPAPAEAGGREEGGVGLGLPPLKSSAVTVNVQNVPVLQSLDEEALKESLGEL